MGNPFRGETVTLVSSVIYNLAGDTAKLKSFIKKTIFQSVFLVDETNIAKSISSSIFNSHGFSLRHYIYWLSHGYAGKRYKELVGYKSSSLEANTEIKEQDIAIALKPSENTEETCVYIIDYEFTKGDLSWWKGIWLSQEHPDQVDIPFDMSIEYSEENQQQMILSYVDTSTTPSTDIIYTVPLGLENSLPEYDKDAQYLFVKYQYMPCLDENNDNILDTYYAALEQWKLDMTHALEEGLGYPKLPEKPIPDENEPIQYFIYKKGSNLNSDIENLFPKSAPKNFETELVPPIPFRLNNINLSQVFLPSKKQDENIKKKATKLIKNFGKKKIEDLYKYSKRAFNKAYKVNGYKELDKVILENKKIGDIDYAYLFFGVSLNTFSFAGKEYLYKFFKLLHDNFGGSLYPTISYQQVYISGTDSLANEIFIKANDEPLNFSYKIRWNSSSYQPKILISSLPFTPEFDSKKNYTVCMYTKTIRTDSEIDQDGNQVGNIPIGEERRTYFLERVNKTHCNCLIFYNLNHYNYVYDWEEVRTSAKSAFELNPNWQKEDEWEESPFIIPIHMGIFRNLSPLTQAELGEVSAYMIFNCYEKKRLKWYQTKSFGSFFQWISVVIAILTWGYSSYLNAAAAAENAASTGVAVATTETIAKTAMSMIVKAAVAFAAAKLIIKALTPLIGTKAATITGVLIASIASISYEASSFSEMFEALTQAPNLIRLGLSTLDGYSKGLHAETQQYILTSQQKIAEMQNQIQEFNRKYSGILKETNGWANESFWFRLRTEISPDGYFHFTLPRGAEIAERTLDWTTNYPEYSVNTYLATS